MFCLEHANLFLTVCGRFHVKFLITCLATLFSCGFCSYFFLQFYQQNFLTNDFICHLVIYGVDGFIFGDFPMVIITKRQFKNFIITKGQMEISEFSLKIMYCCILLSKFSENFVIARENRCLIVQEPQNRESTTNRNVNTGNLFGMPKITREA